MKKSIVALALAGGLIAGPALAMPAFAEDAPAEPVKLDSVQAGVTHEGTPLERAEKILEEANAIVAELDAKRATLNEWQGKAEEALNSWVTAPSYFGAGISSESLRPQTPNSLP